MGLKFIALSLENWYLLLEKPAFTQSSQIFFPACVTHYILMGISLYLVWEKDCKNRKLKKECLFSEFS
nr:tryptophan-rich sensory protein [Methanosarcina barkeri]